MCWCHTGVWDFGHTGVTITEAKAIYHENVTQFIFLFLLSQSKFFGNLIGPAAETKTGLPKAAPKQGIPVLLSPK